MYGKNLWRVSSFLANGISLRLGEEEMKKIVAGSTVHRHSRLRHPDVHQHGVPIQNSINLRKSFLAYETLYWPESWRVTYLSRFISQIPDIYLLSGFDFFISWWSDSENQQSTGDISGLRCRLWRQLKWIVWKLTSRPKIVLFLFAALQLENWQCRDQPSCCTCVITATVSVLL